MGAGCGAVRPCKSSFFLRKRSADKLLESITTDNVSLYGIRKVSFFQSLPRSTRDQSLKLCLPVSGWRAQTGRVSRVGNKILGVGGL